MKISGTQFSRVFVTQKTWAQIAEEEQDESVGQAALEADLATQREAVASGELTLELPCGYDGEGHYIGVPVDEPSPYDKYLEGQGFYMNEEVSYEQVLTFQLGCGEPALYDLPHWFLPAAEPIDEEGAADEGFTADTFGSYLENLDDESLKVMSQFLYGQHVEQVNPDHILRRVEDNFSRTIRIVAAKCAGFYKANRKAGREPLYTVEQLCRGLLLKYLYGWSLRDTEEEIRSKLLNRWFMGLPIIGPSPDHSTLFNFENWMRENHPRLLFTEILKRIDEDFPEEREAIQYGDTFAMYTRAAAVSRTVMLRRCAGYLLKEIGKIYPMEDEWLQEAEFWGRLWGAKDEKREYLLSIDERKERDVATAQAAHPVLAQVRSHMARLNSGSSEEQAEIHKWLGLLEKMLRDDFEFTLDEAGKVVYCQLRVKKVKGSYRLGSAVDPEATFRKHGDKSDLGYNVNLAVTANFVREIQAYTGATPDAVGVAPLAAAQLEHMAFAPSMLAYDQAAGFPKYIADVHKASGEQTQLVVRLVRQGRKGKFSPNDFTLHEEGHLVCPNGVISTKFYPSTASDGWKYRFTKKQCAGCPLIDPCRGGKMNGHRSVTISNYTYQRREAIAFQESEEFDTIMRGRSTVERVLSGVVRYNDARQAKGYGLSKADFQARMGAIAYNLKRWATLTRKKQRKIYRIDPHAPPIEGDELWI